MSESGWGDIKEEKKEKFFRFQVTNQLEGSPMQNQIYGIAAKNFHQLEEKIAKFFGLEIGKFEVYYSDTLINGNDDYCILLSQFLSGSYGQLSLNVTKPQFQEKLKLFHSNLQQQQVVEASKESPSFELVAISEGDDDKECEEIYRLWSVAHSSKSRLEKSFFDIIVLDFHRFQRSRTFFNVSPEFLSALCAVEDVPFVNSEVEILEVISRWHKYRPQFSLTNILSKVHLHTITPETLINQVEPLNVLPIEVLYSLIHSWAINSTPTDRFTYIEKSQADRASYQLRPSLIAKYESTIEDYFKNSTKWQYSPDLSINSILQSAKYVPYKLKVQPNASFSVISLINGEYNNGGAFVHSTSTGELCYIEAIFPYHVVVNRIILSAPTGASFTAGEVDYRLEYITIDAANEDGSNYAPIHKIEVGYPRSGAYVIDFSDKKIIAKKIRLSSYISVGTGTLIFE